MVKKVITEMTDANVGYISLVKRGANKIPFRVLKSEEGGNLMINLNGLSTAISRVLKGEAQAVSTGPVIVGVATAAKVGPELEAVRKSLEDNGFKVDAMETGEDGTTVFRQETPVEGGEYQLVKLSADVALVMKSFAPYSDEVSSDFVTAVKAQGFYDSVRTATSVFTDTLYTLLYNSSSPTDAVGDATKLFTDFQTYVTGLINGLPSQAFKMEAEVAKALTLIQKTEEPVVEPAKVEEGEKPAAPEAPAVPEVPAAPEAPAVEPVVEPVTAPAPVAEAVVKSEGGLEEILKSLTSLTALVQKTAEGQATLVETQKELGGRVDEIARKSESAVTAVNGLVAAPPAGGDTPSGQLVQKTENPDPRTGMFDTAMIPRQQRNK
jgi:hypothetical protein